MNERSKIKDRKSKITLAAAGAAMLIVAAAATAATDVASLRGHAEASGASVTLREIAHLEGDYAEGLGGVEVATFAAGRAERSVTMRAVRERLTEHGVHWGRLILRGASSVTLRRAAPTPERAGPEAAEPMIPPGDAPAEANPVPEIAISSPDGFAPSTLRRRIAEWVRERVGVERPDIKITFEDEEDSSWGTGAPVGRLEIEPLGRDLLGRVPIVVRRYRGDRLIATDRVRIDVRVRRSVVTARNLLHRDQAITAGDVELKEVWLDTPIERPLTDPARAVGFRAAGMVRSGAVLREEDVRPAILVERGQLVTVRCISGGLVLKTVGRAMEDGEGGQLITVRNERTRKTFHARVSGPQEAVLTVGRPGGLAARPTPAREANP